MTELINSLISKFFYSPWGAIVGGLVGCLLGHWLAIGRDKRSAFAIAGNEFINAFKEFIVLLESGATYERSGTLISCPIPDHLAAAIVFSRHLGWFRRQCFDRKLTKYKHAAEKYGDEAEKCSGVKNIPHETNLKLIKQINSLLKYANPK